MRGAFVIRFAPESQPAQLRFAGWIEEVDSGREIRFLSTEELLGFLAGCLNRTFDLSRARSTKRRKSRLSADGEK